jgi:hypothetical protein
MKTIQALCYAKKLLLPALFSLVLLQSCKKIMEDNVPADITYNSGRNMLVFRNMKALQQKMDTNEITNGRTFTEISSTFPAFLSMKKVFDRFETDETALLEKLPDSLNTTNLDWKKYLLMSDLGKQYKNMILVKQYSDNLEYYYAMNVNQSVFANLINPEGLLAVNDSIYQFSEKYVKIITDGDYAKIASLDAVTATNTGNHIIVVNGTEFILGYFKTGAVAAGSCDTTWDKDNTTEAFKKRIIMKVRFDQHPEGVFTVTTCRASLESLDEKRAPWHKGWVSVKTPADYIILAGQFAAPRAPLNNVTGVTGYMRPNPFSMYYSSAVTHFKDISYQYQPCYIMTQAIYEIFAHFDTHTVAATVLW